MMNTRNLRPSPPEESHLYHTHVCTVCRTAWCHRPDEIPENLMDAIQAHTCPKCGKLEFTYDHHETKKPVYCSNGVRCMMLDGSGSTIEPHKPYRAEVIQEIAVARLRRREMEAA